METMEARMVKLYARNNNHVALHAIPGHFATSHSHINFYIDMTSLKTRANEAQEVAKSLAGDYVNSTGGYDRLHGRHGSGWCLSGTGV